MSHNLIKLKIATPDGIALNEDVYSINLKTEMGEITILPKHIPLISVLKEGLVIIKSQSNSEAQKFFTKSGVVEVKKDGEVIILSDHVSKI